MRTKWIYLLLTACVLWSCSDNEEQTLVPLLVVTVLYFLLVWLLAALFNLITRGLSRPRLR